MDDQNMTEMGKLKAGLPYRYDDPEFVAMKDTASLRCARLNAVDPLDAAGREAAAGVTMHPWEYRTKWYSEDEATAKARAVGLGTGAQKSSRRP